MSQDHCKYCDKPIDSIAGHKPRKYCNNKLCRKRASRERREKQKLTDLETRWERFPSMREWLKKKLEKCGFRMASCATDALEEYSRSQPPDPQEE